MAPSFFLRFDGLAHYAEISRATGTIALTMPSLSAAVGASFGKTSVRTDISLGARAGYVWMSGVSSGETTSGTRQNGVWAGPELSLECAPWPRARIHPLASVSLGVHMLGVRGTVNQGRDVMATGIWSGVSVGAALR